MTKNYQSDVSGATIPFSASVRMAMYSYQPYCRAVRHGGEAGR